MKIEPSTLEQDLVARLKATHALICTAESCTGGLIANRITNVSGASEVFWGSWVVYENAAKTSLLGVSVDLIKVHGAVSAQVAQALAEAGLKHLQYALGPNSPAKSRLYCLATTGIAGPTGGTPNKPVGLCYIALARMDQPTHIQEERASPHLGRAEMKNHFATKALELVLSRMP